MPNRTEARPAKAARTNATGRLPLLRLFSTPLIFQYRNEQIRHLLDLTRRVAHSRRDQDLQQSGRVTNASRDADECF
jgi:hypothetical protein